MAGSLGRDSSTSIEQRQESMKLKASILSSMFRAIRTQNCGFNHFGVHLHPRNLVEHMSPPEKCTQNLASDLGAVHQPSSLSPQTPWFTLSPIEAKEPLETGEQGLSFQPGEV